MVGKLKLFFIWSVIGVSLVLFLFYRHRDGRELGFFSSRTSTMDILQGALQDDPCVVDVIRKILIPPSSYPYNLRPTGQDDEGAYGSLDGLKKEVIEKYIDTKDTGFFIECGANDGEYHSFSLQIELDYKWRGLLVEPDPKAFEKLKATNRKAWLLNACLSPVANTSQFTFFVNPGSSPVGGLYSHPQYGATEKTTYQCFPLYAILVAMNITVVDYFHLDIEGAELEVIKTIPFDKIAFKMISLEHWHVPGGLKSVQDFLETKDFVFLRELNGQGTHDSIYVHKSLTI